MLNRVLRASEKELREMKEESANIKHAIVSFVSLLGYSYITLLCCMYMY